MEYICKNSKNEDPLHIYLREQSMLMVSLTRELIITYSSIERITLIKGVKGLYRLQFITVDKQAFTISNRYIHSTGKAEDKSTGYSMFVRVLYMHLKSKSKARITCRTSFHIPDWQKMLVVLFSFGISYWLDFMGAKLFHPAIHGVALSAIALLIITLSEKNSGAENPSSTEIPKEFLPA
jgi:uncharacterized membrane-anchored protein